MKFINYGLFSVCIFFFPTLLFCQNVKLSDGFSPDAPELNESAYVINVELSTQKVHVYHHSEEIRSMICSTGISTHDNATPFGRYIIDKSGNTRGEWFFSKTFGEGAKYWVGFIGGLYLFHSVPMNEQRQILQDQQALLGQPASHGCVRLSVEDAKWFYYNVPTGSVLYITGITPGEESLPMPPIMDKTDSALWLTHRHQSYYQQHLLSCELALIRLVLAMADIDIDEETVLDQLPKGINPENSFVCTNIDQGRRDSEGRILWDNYGAHPPVVKNSILYWFNIYNRNTIYTIQEEQLTDNELRSLCINDDSFMGAIIWVVGHPDRWGTTPKMNDRGMVLGEHVRFLNPILADSGDFLVWDPEASADQPRHYSSLPTREIFQNRVILIKRNN